MNVLIDTNVLLSAALRDKLPERGVIVATRIVTVGQFSGEFGIL
jgi:predicted nucleic acid-binding protein